MDIHLHSNPPLHYGLNGCHQAPHPNDDGLQFLSLEEKECLLFFDGTIDALEEGLEDDNTESSSGRTTFIENCQTSFGPTVPPISTAAVSHSMIEHDIIDLVHTTSDFSMPDFQSLATPPEFNIETKPKKDPAKTFTSNLPDLAPNVRSAMVEESTSHQPPANSVSVIGSKMAEQHQAGRPVTPSMLIERQRSLESKRGPPTHAKPTRFPNNINQKLGTREVSPHSIALEAVNAQERRSQMLASLPASAHPLDRGEPACVRNLPTRSVSFRDLTPEKSRMEALTMLGLTRSKTMSAVTNTTPVISAKIESHDKRISSDTPTPSNGVHTPNFICNSSTGSDVPVVENNNSSTVVTTYCHGGGYELKGDVADRNLNSYGGKSAAVVPANADPVDAGERISSGTATSINGCLTPNFITTCSTGSDITVGQKKSSSTLVTTYSHGGGYELKSDATDGNFNSYGVKSAAVAPANVDPVGAEKICSGTPTPINGSHTSNFITTVSTGSDVTVGQNKSSSTVVAPYSHGNGYEPKARSDIADGNVISYRVKSAAVAPANADPVGAGERISSGTTTPINGSHTSNGITASAGSDVTVVQNKSRVKSEVVTPANADPVGAGESEQRPSPATMPSSAEVKRSDFNSYGGKSIMVNPSAGFKAGPAVIRVFGVKPEPSEIHLNSYGGRSRIIHPSVHVDTPAGPACRPRSNSHSPSNTITPTVVTQYGELHNATGVQSKVYPFDKTDGQKVTVPNLSGRNEVYSDLTSHDAKSNVAVTPSHPDRIPVSVSQSAGRTRRASAPPMPAPKPQRYTLPTSAHRTWSESVPQEIRSKPAPKPLFRTQGITVQFSGKGATDEARRDALRKLGLLKDT